MDAEFDQLYAQLRLTPACSLDELHRAFRRAVSELHPDRAGSADGEAQSRLRELIHAAHPEVVEEWKWGGPVWSHAGILCTGETYKAKVKLTFAHGAALPSPAP